MKDMSFQNRQAHWIQKWMHKDPYIDMMSGNVITPQIEAIKSSKKEKYMLPRKDWVPKWHQISPSNIRCNISNILKILREMIFGYYLYAQPNCWSLGSEKKDSLRQFTSSAPFLKETTWEGAPAE